MVSDKQIPSPRIARNTFFAFGNWVDILALAIPIFRPCQLHFGILSFAFCFNRATRNFNYLDRIKSSPPTFI